MDNKHQVAVSSQEPSSEKKSPHTFLGALKNKIGAMPPFLKTIIRIIFVLLLLADIVFFVIFALEDATHGKALLLLLSAMVIMGGFMCRILTKAEKICWLVFAVNLFIVVATALYFDVWTEQLFNTEYRLRDEGAYGIMLVFGLVGLLTFARAIGIRNQINKYEEMKSLRERMEKENQEEAEKEAEKEAALPQDESVPGESVPLQNWFNSKGVDNPFNRENFNVTFRQALTEFYTVAKKNGVLQNDESMSQLGMCAADRWLRTEGNAMRQNIRFMASLLQYLYGTFGRKIPIADGELYAFFTGLLENQDSAEVLKSYMTTGKIEEDSDILPTMRTIDIVYLLQAWNAFLKLAYGMQTDYYFQDSLWQNVDAFDAGLKALGMRVDNIMMRRMERASAVMLFAGMEEGNCFDAVLADVAVEGLFLQYPEKMQDNQISENFERILEQSFTSVRITLARTRAQELSGR